PGRGARPPRGRQVLEARCGGPAPLRGDARTRGAVYRANPAPDAARPMVAPSPRPAGAGAAGLALPEARCRRPARRGSRHELRAPRVASSADAHVTFLKLVDPKELPDEFVAAVRAIDYSSASFKINVALSELPDFAVGAAGGLPPHAHLRGTIHIASSLDYMEQAFDDAKYGRPSANPILECTIPSVVDPTVAPAGKHVMSVFAQY